MITNVTKTFLPPVEEYTQYLGGIWKSRWVTSNGELYTKLGHQLQDYLGVPNLTLVTSGTKALEIALKCLDIEGEVITTPLSYIATTSSLIWIGCKPVFVDVEPGYLTLDPTKIEAAITEKTSAILATHLYGNPCDVEAIDAIAKKYNLKVVYDAAHTFNGKYKGTSISNFGDAAAISFNATKTFHTIEGGGVITSNINLATKANNIANFGFKGFEMGFDNVGTNGKLTELHAAIGLAVLPYVEEIITKRKKICELYDSHVSKVQGISRQKLREGTEYSYIYYPLIFESESSLLKVSSALIEHNIIPRRYFYPSLTELFPDRKYDVPIARDIANRVLCLPLFFELEESLADKIGKIVTANC